MKSYIENELKRNKIPTILLDNQGIEPRTYILASDCCTITKWGGHSVNGFKALI